MDKKTLEDLLRFRTIGRYPVQVVRNETGQIIKALLINKPKCLPRLITLGTEHNLPAKLVFKIKGNKIDLEGCRILQEFQKDELAELINADGEEVAVIVWHE